MDKLKAAQLYRNKLIPINGKLVERYNQCLIMLGFTNTKLLSFTIDGLGWSPEIAEEKNDLHYLNNGEANPNAIILTPLQQGKPVYMPFHTFDREMMQHIFHKHGEQINDITRDSAICVHFDQHIDAFYEPLDLLKYGDISISFRLVNNLDKVQKLQFEMIDKFKQAHNFIDEQLHQVLLESAQTYGDLRHRNLVLEDLYYTTDSFYTKAFGGVFVLRDFITPIVVFQDEKWHKEAIRDTAHDVLIYHISQPELMNKLRDHLIINYDLDAAIKAPSYHRIKKFMFAQLLKDPTHPIKDILNDAILFKGYLNKLSIEDRTKVMSVERYLEKIEISNQHKLVDTVDLKLFEALNTPHSSLHVKHQDLIWKLLVNSSPMDVLYLYWYDKDLFYQLYKDWDDSLKDWVIEEIRNNI